MDEMELLRAHHDAQRPPSAEVVTAARNRLASQAAPEPAATRSWIRRPKIMIAAGMALAAAAAAVIVTSTGHGPPGTGSSVHLTYAAEVLDKAAQTAAAGVTLHPRPDQWIYQKYVQRGDRSDDPSAVYTNEAWARFDGRQDAHYVKGRLVIRPTPAGLHGTLEAAYAAINSLPPDPKALLAVIYRRVDAIPRGQWAVSTRDAEAFNTLGQMMINSPLAAPPPIEAALYRAMARIPGVSVDGNAVDSAGRPAIKVTNGDFVGFLLDPRTYRLIGATYGIPASPPGLKPDRPHTPWSDTRVATAIVDHPGQR
jgi:hypothetical protein